MLGSPQKWPGAILFCNLIDIYQYQILLWQAWWNQQQARNRIGPALSFRQRGRFQSWRRETMAEAIFAVLREGLSLTQAAHTFKIPYSTYAHRVHNKLGPSKDVISGTVGISDTKPKSKTGRPPRIFQGSWPEEHIKKVIRAVVFKNNPVRKDNLPKIFNAEIGLFVPRLTERPSAQIGLDISWFNFATPCQSISAIGSSNNSRNTNLHHHPQLMSTPPQLPTACRISTNQQTGNPSKLNGWPQSCCESGY